MLEVPLKVIFAFTVEAYNSNKFVEDDGLFELFRVIERELFQMGDVKHLQAEGANPEDQVHQ